MIINALMYNKEKYDLTLSNAAEILSKMVSNQY